MVLKARGESFCFAFCKSDGQGFGCFSWNGCFVDVGGAGSVERKVEPGQQLLSVG